MLAQIIFLSLALLVQVTFSQKFGLANSNYGFGFGQGSRVPAMSGGGFQVTSYSPISATGISVVSQNQIEGPLSVGGQLPLQGAVSFETKLPSCGSASVNYCCGNKNVGINQLSHGSGIGHNLHGLGGSGLIGASLNGPSLFDSNLANPSLTTPNLIGPSLANSAVGTNFIGVNNAASGSSSVIHHLPSGGSAGLASGVANQGISGSIGQGISGTGHLSAASALVNAGISGQIAQGQIVGPGLDPRSTAGQGYNCAVNGLY